jgi:hypothetical protein
LTDIPQDDSETSVESSDFAASLEARREMWLATSSSGSPDAFLLSIALERVTIERFMLARVVAAAVVPRSAAESP